MTSPWAFDSGWIFCFSWAFLFFVYCFLSSAMENTKKLMRWLFLKKSYAMHFNFSCGAALVRFLFVNTIFF